MWKVINGQKSVKKPTPWKKKKQNESQVVQSQMQQIHILQFHDEFKIIQKLTFTFMPSHFVFIYFATLEIGGRNKLLHFSSSVVYTVNCKHFYLLGL